MDAAIIVNATAAEYYKQPFFYAMGHFSKFLMPGSRRCDTNVTVDFATTSEDNLLVTSFVRPDKATVLTVLNKNAMPLSMTVHDARYGHVVVQLKAESLQTLLWY